MIRLLHQATLAAAALLLASCALLERPREVHLYAPALQPLETAPAPAAARSWRLAVDEPQAIAPFDAERMVVAPQPGELQYYANARWRDHAPLMVQDLLLQAFDEAAPQAHAARNDPAEFRLRSDLRALTADYRGASMPTVVVRLDAQLLRRADGEVVAARRFDVERPCAGTQLPQVFAAFEQALNRLSRDVVEWTVAQADGDAARSNEKKRSTDN